MQQRPLVCIYKSQKMWKLKVTNWGIVTFPDGQFRKKEKAIDFARTLHPDAKLTFSSGGNP